MFTLQGIVLIVICLGIETESHSKELLEEIWRIRQAMYTCTNKLNYGCQYNATSDFKCIPFDRRCDGRVDCPAGDDETDCPENPCGKDEVCCLGGGCSIVCDGNVQCVNDTDEIFCEPPVPSECPGEMQCPSGECATVCDNNIECDEKRRKDCEEDERDCRFNCDDGEVVCNTLGECGAFCDEEVECPDGYDESMCFIECEPDEVSCELESSGNKGCAELCVNGNQCEADWDESNSYCGLCLECGTTPMDQCTKTLTCP